MNDTRVTRLHATLNRVEARPTEWDQRRYARRFDGVARYCFAGHAAILAGDPPDLIWKFESPYTVSGRLISTVAREWLGLDERAAYRLFAPFNTLDELRRLVAELAGWHVVASTSTSVRRQRVSA